MLRKLALLAMAAALALTGAQSAFAAKTNGFSDGNRPSLGFSDGN